VFGERKGNYSGINPGPIEEVQIVNHTKEPFGAKIRRLRAEKGLTLEALARMAYIRKGYLSMVERGDARPPSPKVVKALARALGQNETDLLISAYIEKAPSEIRDILLRAIEAIGG
jgi:transcriptional regulator with XRE-family HTH domain